MLQASADVPRVWQVEPAHYTKTDFRKLLQTIEDRELRELCICAVSTGLRLGELVALQWVDVDFARKVIFMQNSDLHTTKNKRNRVVPMSQQLWRMLTFRKESASSELVFHRDRKRLSDGWVSKRFKHYVRASGLSEKLHFHSLRHTFASWLAMDGVSLYAIQKLLGHSSSSVTQMYSHLQPEQLHSTVNRIDVPLD